MLVHLLLPSNPGQINMDTRTIVVFSTIGSEIDAKILRLARNQYKIASNP